MRISAPCKPVHTIAFVSSRNIIERDALCDVQGYRDGW